MPSMDQGKMMAVSGQIISALLFLVAVFTKDLTAAAVFWLAAAVWRNGHA